MKINEKALSAACAAFNSCQSVGDIGYPIAMRMQSAIAEYLAAIEEAGFVVVPREPTEEQVIAISKFVTGWEKHPVGRHKARGVYRAMLAASDAT